MGLPSPEQMDWEPMSEASLPSLPLKGLKGGGLRRWAGERGPKDALPPGDAVPVRGRARPQRQLLPRQGRPPDPPSPPSPGLDGVEQGGDEWGRQANAQLSRVQGKDFRHEKTKKKRGSYKGGPINTGVASYKFGDDE